MSVAPSLRCSEDAANQPTAEKTASKRFKTQLHTDIHKHGCWEEDLGSFGAKEDKKGQCGRSALSLALGAAPPDLTPTWGGLADTEYQDGMQIQKKMKV